MVSFHIPNTTFQIYEAGMESSEEVYMDDSSNICGGPKVLMFFSLQLCSFRVFNNTLEIFQFL